MVPRIFQTLRNHRNTPHVRHCRNYCLKLVCTSIRSHCIPFNDTSFQQSLQFKKIIPVPLELEKEMATHSSILAWRIPGTEEPGGLLSMGSHRVKHNWSNLAAAAAAAPWTKWGLGARPLSAAEVRLSLYSPPSVSMVPRPWTQPTTDYVVLQHIFGEKRSAHKWSHTVQTCVIQKATVQHINQCGTGNEDMGMGNFILRSEKLWSGQQAYISH